MTNAPHLLDNTLRIHPIHRDLLQSTDIACILLSPEFEILEINSSSRSLFQLRLEDAVTNLPLDKAFKLTNTLQELAYELRSKNSVSTTTACTHTERLVELCIENTSLGYYLLHCHAKNQKQSTETCADVDFKGLIRFTKNGHCIDINEHFLSISGYAKTDLLGKSIRQIQKLIGLDNKQLNGPISLIKTDFDCQVKHRLGFTLDVSITVIENSTDITITIEEKGIMPEPKHPNQLTTMFQSHCQFTQSIAWEYLPESGKFYLIRGIPFYDLPIGTSSHDWEELSALLPDTFLATFKKELNKSINSHSSFEFEIEGRSAQQNTWYRINGTFQGDQLVTGSIRDITREKLLEHEKALSDSIIEALPGIFYLLDVEGNYIRWNKNTEKVTSYTASDLLNGTPFNNLDEDQRQYLFDRMNELFKDGEASEELPLITKNGTKIPYYFTGKRITLDGKEYLIGMGNDISELVNIRKKLEFAERRAKIGYWELDQNQLTSTYWTKGMYQILEINPEDGMLPLEQIAMNIHSDDRPKFEELLGNILTIQEETATLRYITPTGNIKHIFLSILRNHRNPHLLEGVIQDITESELRDQKIQLIQERFNLIVQATTDAIFEWNPVTNNAWWSDSHYELFGFNKSEPLPGFDRWLKRVYYPDQFLIKSAVAEMVSGKINEWNEEVRLIDENFKLKTLLVRCFSIKASEGIRILGSFIDITQQKQNELALVDTNRRYEMITKATQDGIWDWDIEHDTITGNKRLRDLYEIPTKKLGIEDFMERVHPDDRKRIQENLNEALKNKKNSISEEFRFRTKDHYRIIQDKAYIVYNEFGSPIRMMGAMQDITMQRESERELQELSNRLLLATSAGQLGIFDWSIANDKLVFNEYMYDMFELNPVDFDHKLSSWIECMNLVDSEGLKFLKNGELKIIKNVRKTVRCTHADGSIHHIEIHMIVLRSDKGIPESVIGVCRDITETINAEQQVAKAIIKTQEQERMETGQELHDNVVQTLVASMMNLTHAADKLTGPLHLVDNVKELIATAINDSRKLSHRLAPSHLMSLRLDEAIENLIDGMHSGRDMKFETRYELPNDVTISNELKLNIYRIVQEQISNTIKHAKAKKVWIQITEDKNKIRLITRDNGVGFNVRSSRRGIGLNNITRRAKVFGGDLEIHSSPGKGCKIIIEIPYSNG